MASGTPEDPWVLKTPSLQSEYTAHRDPDADPPALVAQVGKTEVRYRLQCIEDLHAWLTEQGDWVRARQRRRAEGGQAGDRRGLGALVRESGRRVLRPQEGAARALRQLRAAGARGARARRGRAQRPRQPHARALTSGAVGRLASGMTSSGRRA